MLKVYYGDMPESVYNPAIYFKNTCEDTWITDDLMDFGDGEFEIEILNTNQIVHNMEELIPIAGMLVR